MKYIKWVLWTLYYLPQRSPQSIKEHIQRGCRLRSPWWEFQPYMRRNNEGQQWEIYFINEEDYVKPNHYLKCNVHIGQETGKIIGLTIYDEDLRV